MIYLIEAINASFLDRMVKIGVSDDPLRRLARLDVGPHELVLLAVAPGDRTIERELHQRYDEQRYRGEWFQLKDRQVAELVDEMRWWEVGAFVGLSPVVKA